jgi:two-component system chemotaxis response regulator CheY
MLTPTVRRAGGFMRTRRSACVASQRRGVSDPGRRVTVLRTTGGTMAKTFLIVDDSASMRQLIAFTIKDAGYEVLLAENGTEALEKLQSARVDMVITDLNMPEMDGITFIRELRGKADYKFVPIVMLTTESQEAKKQEGRAAGASGWIVKPFSPSQLMDVIKKFVKERGQ